MPMAMQVARTRLSLVGRHLVRSLHVSKADCSTTTAAVLQSRRKVEVCGSQMSYLDIGSGDKTVIFLHGNPTAAYLWRNIIPHVTGVARCLAPDLIGMGHSDKQSSHDYTFVNHYKYLCEWMKKVNLPEKVVIVCHDWGSGLGFHWTHEHNDRVEGLVHMESLVAPMRDWSFFPDIARDFFKALRSEAGEQMVLEKNLFVERLLPGAILRKLTDEEMNEYRAPYLEPGESRRPTLTWPRQIPVKSDGPEDVVAIASAYSKWLSTSDKLPKLYIHAEPGFFAPVISQVTQNWPNQKVVKAKGSHFLQEDSPDTIGKAIAEFVRELP